MERRGRSKGRRWKVGVWVVVVVVVGLVWMVMTMVVQGLVWVGVAGLVWMEMTRLVRMAGECRRRERRSADVGKSPSAAFAMSFTRDVPTSRKFGCVFFLKVIYFCELQC